MLETLSHFVLYCVPVLLREAFKKVDSEMPRVQIEKEVETLVWPHHPVKLLGLSCLSHHTSSPDLEHLGLN